MNIINIIIATKNAAKQSRQNQNGKLFSDFLEENPTLIAVNALDIM